MGQPTTLSTRNVFDVLEPIPDQGNIDEDINPLLDPEVALIIQWITITVVCQIINLFGIGANVINIICFVKQGLKDAVNVSLLALAISDLGCLLTLVWSTICLTPAMSTADLPFDSVEISFLTSGIPHTIFTRVTTWITALITLERCLCISKPLKVKSLVTSKRVCVIIVCVFIIFTVSGSPVYVVSKLGMKFSSQRNKTFLGLVYTKDREIVETTCFAINNVFFSFTAFVIIITCTIILVIKLQQTTIWRKPFTTSTHADNISVRNKKIAKMVTIISSLFICCFVPLSIIFIAFSLLPGFSLHDEYGTVLITAGGFGIVLESINSSGNIFIYYKMNSKFRATFRQWFFS